MMRILISNSVQSNWISVCNQGFDKCTWNIIQQLSFNACATTCSLVPRPSCVYARKSGRSYDVMDAVWDAV